MLAAVRSFAVILLTGAIASSAVHAQARLPKPPDSYDVEFRYRIKAGRTERIVQFGDMVKYLSSVGFKRIEGDDTDLDIFDATAERMNGTIKDVTVKRVHQETHDQLSSHLSDFIDAYNFSLRLKALKGLTSYEANCKTCTTEPQRFNLVPIHQMQGLNTRGCGAVHA